MSRGDPGPRAAGDAPGSTDVDHLVAPALELAVVVARVCAQLRPPVPVPKRLRALSHWAKLPPTARPTVRSVLDEDDEFRARVAAAAGELDLPRPSWLFVHRPEGWEAELDGLARDAGLQVAATEAERSERAVDRRLAGAEAAVVRLEREVVAARAGVDRLTEEVATERRARREAEERAQELEQRVGVMGGELEQARTELSARAEEVRSLGRRLSEARRQVGAARQPVSAAPATPATSAAPAIPAAPLAPAAVEPPAPPVPSPPPAPPPPAVAEAFEDAGRAASDLGRALVVLGEALTGDRPLQEPAAVKPVGSDPAARRHRSRSRRRPAPLPPAVFDDSPEAAEHLMRIPGMLVLVDGYNVTLSTWQDLPIARQRDRLVDACRELSARSGAQIMVIFDGAEEPSDLPPPEGTGRVRWQFSPPGVEADDVLLSSVDALAVDRPVTVASSDRRVRDGARERGANAISTPQLLSTLRREAGRLSPPG